MSRPGIRADGTPRRSEGIESPSAGTGASSGETFVRSVAIDARAAPIDDSPARTHGCANRTDGCVARTNARAAGTDARTGRTSPPCDDTCPGHATIAGLTHHTLARPLEPNGVTRHSLVVSTRLTEMTRACLRSPEPRRHVPFTSAHGHTLLPTSDGTEAPSAIIDIRAAPSIASSVHSLRRTGRTQRQEHSTCRLPAESRSATCLARTRRGNRETDRPDRFPFRSDRDRRRALCPFLRGLRPFRRALRCFFLPSRQELGDIGSHVLVIPAANATSAEFP